ncbi:Ent-kaurenoic acid oxidase 2 [Asimina triloba]
MDLSLGLVVFTAFLAGFTTFLIFLKKVNIWVYERKLGERRFSLPPGDLGWPIIGNMWAFLVAFKLGDPDSFISSFVKRYGRTGIYKAFMFRSPTIMVTIPETCKQVLMDAEHFVTGWPASTVSLLGRKSFIGISTQEHQRLRHLTAAPINGHEALSIYLKFIETAVVSALERWAAMDQLEFLTEVRRLTFRIITHIFLSSEGDPAIEALEREYSALNYGIRAMAINFPGFAYHRALKARKKLVAIMQSALTKRREKRGRDEAPAKKDMMDALIEVEDENGKRLDDEEIIDVLLMYLNAGHESSGHITMWAAVLLQEHPEFFQKAKVAEQEEIIRKRPPTQKGLTFEEVRQMEYLSKVIDETLRLINISLVVFREATTDVKLNGYMIPKGWKVQVWLRSVHLDPAVYTDAKTFDPERWNGYIPRMGSFIPFGAGSRLCPGNDLAKMEISVFLHYFLLGYQ